MTLLYNCLPSRIATCNKHSRFTGAGVVQIASQPGSAEDYIIDTIRYKHGDGVTLLRINSRVCVTVAADHKQQSSCSSCVINNSKSKASL